MSANEFGVDGTMVDLHGFLCFGLVNMGLEVCQRLKSKGGERSRHVIVGPTRTTLNS